VTEPVDTEKGVPDGFFLTSNVHKIHFWPGLRTGPRWVSLRHLYMLIKVPVWFNSLYISFIWSLEVLEKSLNLILAHGQEPCWVFWCWLDESKGINIHSLWRFCVQSSPNSTMPTFHDVCDKPETSPLIYLWRHRLPHVLLRTSPISPFPQCKRACCRLAMGIFQTISTCHDGLKPQNFPITWSMSATSPDKSSTSPKLLPDTYMLREVLGKSA